nr:hypothetical protein FVER53263_20322 [Fusarium verticillioides]
MKLISLLVIGLPVVSANYPWWTNSGWDKPADFNSKECAGNPNVNYFCVRTVTELSERGLILIKGTLSGTKGENPEPHAFPWRRYTCSLADTLGRGCNWEGAVGSC